MMAVRTEMGISAADMDRASVSTTSYKISRWVTVEGEKSQVSDTLTFDYKPIEYFHSVE